MRFFPAAAAAILAASLGIAGASDPDELVIIPRADWNAAEARPYASQTPVRFTIHHSGVFFAPDADAAKHLANVQRWGMGEDRKWADIPYHFIIGPKGDIYEGRDPLTEGESNTSYETAGHLQINLLGNFGEQDPTERQLDSLARLLAWASQKYGIAISTLRCHRDFAATACPGDRLYRILAEGEIQKQAARLMAEKAVRKPNPGKAEP